MKSFMGEALDTYVEEHSRARGPLFDELREVTYARANSPGMQVGRVEGALLAMLVKISGARRILEIGTFTGYSALSMAEALPPDGKLVTCDIDAQVVSIAKEFFAKSGFGDRIESRMGDALDTIRAMPRDEVYDLVFIDADKARYPDYYEAVLPHVPVGGLIVADNTLWSGAVLDPKTPDDIGITTFNRLVTGDQRVENVLLPVRDGVMLVRKR
ncbi:MAG: class I SAM-dependent methyltransferase [Polyangiaceae bacterium]